MDKFYGINEMRVKKTSPLFTRFISKYIIGSFERGCLFCFKKILNHTDFHFKQKKALVSIKKQALCYIISTRPYSGKYPRIIPRFEFLTKRIISSRSGDAGISASIASIAAWLFIPF